MNHVGSSKVVVRELRKIAKKNGGMITPEVVVSAATPENSPLHSRFTWDDSEAGALYRLIEARQLINTTVRFIKIKGEMRPVRVFVSLSPDRKGGGGYREMSVALTNPDMRAVLLADALVDLKVFQDRYRHLKELAGVFKEVAKVLAQDG